MMHAPLERLADRHVGHSTDALGHAADEQPLGSGSSLGAHHDEVGISPIGRPSDLDRRMTFHHDVLGAPRLTCPEAKSVVHMSPVLDTQFEVSQDRGGEVHRRCHRFDDMDEMNRGIPVCRERHRGIESTPGEIGEIDRNEELPKCGVGRYRGAPLPAATRMHPTVTGARRQENGRRFGPRGSLLSLRQRAAPRTRCRKYRNNTFKAYAQSGDGPFNPRCLRCAAAAADRHGAAAAPSIGRGCPSAERRSRCPPLRTGVRSPYGGHVWPEVVPRRRARRRGHRTSGRCRRTPRT